MSCGGEAPMVVGKGAAQFSYAGEFVGRVFGEDPHAKRVRSLANATVGVTTSAFFGCQHRRPRTGPGAGMVEQACHQASRSTALESRN